MQADAISFIVKTTFDCDMACRYCYEGHRPKAAKISIETTNNLIDKIGKYAVDTGTRTSFVWHGGEPLLMGKGYYEHVVARQRKVAPSFQPQNLLQTNGRLMDDAFADLLVRSHFSLGVSLDGPPEIHDAQRLTKKAGPTFGMATAAVTSIQRRGYTPGIAAIFTRNTLNHLDSFYDFFRDFGANVKIAPLLVQGRATEVCAEKLFVPPKEYGDALIYLFDKWTDESTQRFVFDPFDSILRRLVSGKNASCVFAGKCHNYFRVFPNGDIYLCGRNDGSENILGNINVDTIQSILASPKRERYAFDKASLKETCGKCEHFDICKGGCTSSGQSVNRDQAVVRDRYCRSHAALFTHIKTFLKKSTEMQPSV